MSRLLAHTQTLELLPCIYSYIMLLLNLRRQQPKVEEALQRLQAKSAPQFEVSSTQS